MPGKRKKTWLEYAGRTILYRMKPGDPPKLWEVQLLTEHGTYALINGTWVSRSDVHILDTVVPKTIGRRSR